MRAGQDVVPLIRVRRGGIGVDEDVVGVELDFAHRAVRCGGIRREGEAGGGIHRGVG